MPAVSDMRLYLRAKSVMARVLTTEGKFEEALSQALPTLAMMDSLGNKDFGDLTQLFIVIGECQQQFGDDRLLQFLRNTQFENAQQLIDAITKEVETHRNGAEPNDDLTVMCMRLV